MKNQTKILKNGQVVSIRTCTKEDLPAILTLQDEVIQSLTETTFLQPLSNEEYLHILTDHGMMIGAFYQDELIAFRALLIPSADEADHLGEDSGVPKEDWPQVIYSEISNVKPSFRGNSLQKILGEFIIEEIDSKRFRYVCATVAPFNIASLLDKFALRLQIVALKEKYEGLLRYILVRDFEEQEEIEEETRFIPMDQIDQQQLLLADGWRGTGLEKRENEWFVKYNRGANPESR